MGKATVSVTFHHPTTVIDAALLELLGQASAQAISSRTQKGVGAIPAPLGRADPAVNQPPLQARYARLHHGGDRTRRLVLTGKMLLSATLQYRRKAVWIVWTDPKAGWHNRKTPWIGLTERDRESVDWAVRHGWQPDFNKNLKDKTRKR